MLEQNRHIFLPRVMVRRRGERPSSSIRGRPYRGLNAIFTPSLSYFRFVFTGTHYRFFRIPITTQVLLRSTRPLVLSLRFEVALWAFRLVGWLSPRPGGP